MEIETDTNTFKTKRNEEDYVTKEELELKLEDPPNAYPTTKTHIKHVFDTTNTFEQTPFCVKPIFKSDQYDFVNQDNCSNQFYVTDLYGKNDMTREEVLEDMKQWNHVNTADPPRLVLDSNGDLRDISDPNLQPEPEVRLAIAKARLEKSEKLVKNMQNNDIDHLFPVYNSAQIRAAKIMSKDPTKTSIAWKHSFPELA